MFAFRPCWLESPQKGDGVAALEAVHHRLRSEESPRRALLIERRFLTLP